MRRAPGVSSISRLIKGVATASLALCAGTAAGAEFASDAAGSGLLMLPSAPVIASAASGGGDAQLQAALTEPVDQGLTGFLSHLAAPLVLNEEAAQAEAAAEKPEPETFWDGWVGSVEFGLNGSDGNSETFSLRGGVSGERITKSMETRTSATYVYSTSDGEKTKSRGDLNLRNDWILGESPWSIYAQGRAEYDEFQEWNWRLSGYGGVGYAVVKNDRTLFRLRAGAGIQREFGGGENAIIPEAQFGFDFSHKLTDRQKIFATGDYYPSLKRFSDYRLVGKAGYELLVDPESNMTLKLGVEDRYDSSPGAGFVKNDLEYFAVLVWSF